jgi:hypothetical protein
MTVVFPTNYVSCRIRGRLALPALALLVVVAACGGDASTPAGLRGVDYAVSRTTAVTGTYALDNQATSPPLTCTVNGTPTTVTGGSLVLRSNGSYIATFTVQEGTATETYQDKGTFTTSGSTIQFRSPRIGTLSGTVSSDGRTISVPNYPYCGTTHTLVFQRQS